MERFDRGNESLAAKQAEVAARLASLEVENARLRTELRRLASDYVWAGVAAQARSVVGTASVPFLPPVWN